MMNFIQDNYVWFIVIGVVLVMALIGFIAEKNGYKKVEKKPKPVKEKKVKEKPVEEVKEEVKEEVAPEIEFNNFDINMETADANKNEETVEAPVSEITPTFEDLNIPTTEPAPIEEDLTVPLNGAKEEAPVMEEIPADLYAPISDVVEEKDEEPISAPNVEPIDAKLPDLNTIKEEEPKASDDDIWKF